MKVLVVGCGLVGKELAQMLRGDGHVVVGTTTTPGKVGTLEEVCDEVVVLKGGDRDKVHAAPPTCDAVVVTGRPGRGPGDDRRAARSAPTAACWSTPLSPWPASPATPTS